MSTRPFGIAVSRNSEFVFTETKTNPISWGDWNEVEDKYSLGILIKYAEWAKENPRHIVAWNSNCRDYYEIINSHGKIIARIEDADDFNEFDHPLKDGLVEFNEEFCMEFD